MSFVYEQQRVKLPVSHKLQTTRDILNEALSNVYPPGFPELPLDAAVTVASSDSRSVDSLLVEGSRICLSLLEPTQPYAKELVYIFIVHCVLLEKLSVQERARPLENMNTTLIDIIANQLFPKMFFVLSHLLSCDTTGLTIDADGRVFVSLIRFICLNISYPISEIIGANTYSRAEKLWVQVSPSTVGLNFVQFVANFPLPTSVIPEPIVRTSEPIRLLPFTNKILESEASLAHVHVEDDSSTNLGDSTGVHLDFGPGGTLFSDTQHWHSSRPILPGYLAGKPDTTRPANPNSWSWRRKLRSDQRFMATLQSQAATLTGASGTSLQQIVIPPVGMLLGKQSKTVSSTVDYRKASYQEWSCRLICADSM